MIKKVFPLDVESILLPWLTTASKRITYHILNTFKEHGLTLSREQMIILAHLQEKDGLVQNDLAFITSRDKTSLTRIINNMEKKGLLKRVRCENDQRRNKIFITTAGINQFKKGIPLVLAIVDKMQAGISKPDIKKAIEVIKKVSQNITELEDEKK
ncbi:MAG: DNA-binding MarR family transcriptional regulator [Chitinophagales bacterium]|jgi:DNA-binding MarR family transcriptional regulator